MSSLSDEEIEYAKELFAGLGDLTTRKMMGGMCLYHEGVIFAMRHGDGRILLKGAGDFIPEIEAAGGVKWEFVRDNGRKGSMPYWTLPEAAMDDPEEACAWARKALSYLG